MSEQTSEARAYRNLVGGRIRRLREAKGFSQRKLANLLHVDATALGSWENGRYLPRRAKWRALVHVLGTNESLLFAAPDDDPKQAPTAELVDTLDQLPELLVKLTNRATSCLRAVRMAAPYPTPAFVQTEWRLLVSARVLDKSLEVQRAEIFYDLRRVQELVSNVLRYDGCHYHVKSYCAGLTDIVPGFGAYLFDEDEILLGAYWTGVPPHRRPGLRLTGTPFQDFFRQYWDEIWRRGTLLNIRGASDLNEIRDLAVCLGLPSCRWNSFVEEARAFDVGDGAPPLV